MPKLPTIPLVLILFRGYAAAADCEPVSASVKTLRDARKRFRCIASKIRQQTSELSAETVPAGAIYARDPLIHDADGEPTGGYRTDPYGWNICNGETSRRT